MVAQLQRLQKHHGYVYPPRLINMATIRGDFTLSSGKRQDTYFDAARLLFHEADRIEACRAMYLALYRQLGGNAQSQFDAIAGIAVGGIPWATMLAELMNKPLLYVLKEPKTHGTRKQVEGVIAEGMSVLLVDDVISTGATVFMATKALNDLGIGVVTTVDVKGSLEENDGSE
jgi:orotate phosphoribosyltransferase